MSEIRLVPVRPEDAELWHRWRGQEATRRHNPLRPSSVEELRIRLQHCGSDFRGEWVGEYRWMAEHDGERVGTVSVHAVNRAMGYAEIGYTFCETRHGRGLGTAAVRLLVDKVFAESELRRLIAYTSVGNEASWKLLERVGFAREGTLRGHYEIEGRHVDQHLYGLLRGA